MKMSFLVSTSDNKIHLIQHDSKLVKRESFAKQTSINVDREWQRWVNSNPDIYKKIFATGPLAQNPYDTPALVGALYSVRGDVRWFDGERKEDWEKELQHGDDTGSQGQEKSSRSSEGV